MHLARLVRRRPTVLLARRPPRAPPIRRYASQNSDPEESLYEEYLKFLQDNAAALESSEFASLDSFKQSVPGPHAGPSHPVDLENDSSLPISAKHRNTLRALARRGLHPSDSGFSVALENMSNQLLKAEQLAEDPKLSKTLETTRVQLEEFKRSVEAAIPQAQPPDPLIDNVGATSGEAEPQPSTNVEDRDDGAAAWSPPFPEKYSDMFKALEELRASDANFPQTLDTMARSLEEHLFDDHPDEFVGGVNTLLDERVVDANPEWEIGWRVAYLVQEAGTDKFRLEQIENKLASYDGPLSRLNVHVEWYLQNPEQIDLKLEEAFSPAASTEQDREESPELVEERENSGSASYDKNSYYYEDTPVDELVAHLRNRDVQYAIKERMNPQDREELFRLLDSIVAPVFNEDMAVLNNIAAIFNKYEDVHLEFTTEPRLPRIRRLDVFKRLLPAPEDEGPSQAEENSEIASIVAETKKQLELVEAEKLAKQPSWPNLMTRDPLLDSRDVLELPPTKDRPFHNRVVVRNHHSIFTEALEADGFDFSNHEATRTDDAEADADSEHQYADILRGLKIVPVGFRQAKQQTSKGKIERFVKIIIVGNGNGMVGVGFGKHKSATLAHSKSLADAVRNMDWVERFEDRTIWTEVRTKFGATIVILRPRPVGFGLRCNPIIHRLLNAAGIKDISAKVWGSRNPIGVLKATLRLLHASHAPLGMGDGLGGPGRKMFKGTGLRNKSQIERARGRRMIDLRV